MDHYFISPDNGILSLIMDAGVPSELCQLEYAPSNTFSLRGLYAFAVSYILANKDFRQIGTPLPELKQRLSLRPVTAKHEIRGAIIHTDGFGNVITNISRDLFAEIGQGRSFAVQAKRAENIRALVRHYSDGHQAEPMCLFNGAGLLEIAVYMDRANVLLNLQKGDPVAVLFDD
jgi:S-adenosylmethionine hydrolase